MAQISRRKLTQKTWERLWQTWVQAMAGPRKPGEMAIILDGLLTATERLMLTKRFVALVLLSSGWKAYQVAEQLKLSISTVYKLARVFQLQPKLVKVLATGVPRIPPPETKEKGSALADFIDDFLAGYRKRGRLYYGKIPGEG